MKIIYLTLFILILTNKSFAVEHESVKNLQDRWSIINYTINEDDREKEFSVLLKEADEVVSKVNNSAESLIWRGIIKSSYANAKGGLGALSIAESSKKDFEEALKINENALDGSAYTSLGVLYAKVPGWPIGFGDEKKAKELLLKALLIDHTSIDANFFYAELLYADRSYKEALSYLEKAKKAPPREGREVADKGRKEEIEDLMKKVNKKIKKS